MLDAKECREHAKNCMRQAAEVTDPIVRQRMSETAQGWARLAADLAKLEEKLAQAQQRLRRGNGQATTGQIGQGRN
jgi:hypothetical protein